jgi:hypothetical protein
VLARRFDAAGEPRGSEIRVNSYTTGWQAEPAVASDATGSFVVTWMSEPQDGSGTGVYAQRYDASGVERGGEFRVHTYAEGYQKSPSVASDPAGSFVVAWTSGIRLDEDSYDVFARRYDATGAALSPEFRVNTFTTGYQFDPSVAVDARGDFVVVWTTAYIGGLDAVFGQRYDASGAPRGAEFQVNSSTTSRQWTPVVASDAAGNFVVIWDRVELSGSQATVFGQRFDASGAPRGAEFQVAVAGPHFPPGTSAGSDAVGNLTVSWADAVREDVFAQRFGGLEPALLGVDAGGNGVLEPEESSAGVVPSWRNVNGAAQTFGGAGLSFTGPPVTGVSYELMDAAGEYGTVANGATAPCSDCYEVGLSFGGTRPSTHWDATFTERITPDAHGQTKPWTLHVGQSFTDVPKTSGYYRFVETLLHKGVAGGCTATTYCPGTTATRGQMAVFALVGKEGSSYSPPACGVTPMFADVPVTSPYCRWIEELVRRGIAGGCGGGNFCPTNVVTRGQMPIFMLKTLDSTIDPPACGTPMFADVPASSPYCKWIEELARRGVVSGCGGGNYCPSSPVNRAQMAVFISATFGLTLYGP